MYVNNAQALQRWIIQFHINTLIGLYKKKYFSVAINKLDHILGKYKNIPLIYNIGGIIHISLERYKDSIFYFSKSLELNPNFVEANNNMGVALKFLCRFEESVNYFRKAINLNNKYANAYNNLGSSLNELGKWEEALNNFNKALELNPNHKDASENLIKLLTFYDPKEKYSNSIIKTNFLLKLNKFNFNFEKKITDKQITKYFEESNDILIKNLGKTNLNLSQIYRRNTLDLNCKRHFEVFNKFNVIPKFCFSCYKIEVKPKTIIDLIKLYLVFDSFKVKKNNTRKCLVELRPKMGGSYKGLIYCVGLNEAKEIIKFLSPILKNTIGENISISIRRGCSEFSVSYPKFKEVNGAMEYNQEWKNKEKIIDDQLLVNKQKVVKDSLFGMTINDILIIQNWLMYAKKIGDTSYKKFNAEIEISSFMEKEFSSQLDHRRKEFVKFN